MHRETNGSAWERTRQYLAVVDRLAAENGHDKLWWASDIASKNRFRSVLPSMLNGTAASESTLSSWLGSLRELVGQARLALRRIRMAQRLFNSKRVNLDSQSCYLIKTFAYTGSFSDAGFDDPFFPGLAEYIQEKSEEEFVPLTIFFDFEKDDSVMKLAARSGAPILPIEAFLRSSDVFSALRLLVGRLINSRFHARKGYTFMGNKLDDVVARAVSGSRVGLPLYHYLHRISAYRIAKQFSPKRCVLTYEGNPWERMFIDGLRNGCSDVAILGYQHSVVPLGAAGMFPGKEEINSAPLPDIVLTTGTAPAEIIREYSALPNDRVVPACALRYDYLYGVENKSEDRTVEPFTFLVAPEGVGQSVDLIAYAASQARRMPEVVFRVRPHPVLPFQKYEEWLGRELLNQPNIIVSKNRTVAEDLAECSALLYWGSTVALEGLMVGKPLVHFDRNDGESYDPLFNFNAYKWTVRNSTPLVTVVKTIIGLGKDDRRQLTEEGREYVRRYFLPVTDKTLECFIQNGVRRPLC